MKYEVFKKKYDFKYWLDIRTFKSTLFQDYKKINLTN